MLRDYVYDLDAAHISEVFQQFDLKRPEDETHIALIEFRMLTPDSFMWRFRIDEAVYYLYAEDYVEGLDSVKATMLAAIKKDISLEFIEVKQPKPFHDSEPYVGATTYQEPKDSDALMRYAVDSGHDFVFLCKSNEDASNAYFNQ